MWVSGEQTVIDAREIASPMVVTLVCQEQVFSTVWYGLA
jgi:hypothetical protein